MTITEIPFNFEDHSTLNTDGGNHHFKFEKTIMGKKSKRSRSSKANSAPRTAPALRKKEEIKEDLEFEDDDVEQWEDDDDDAEAADGGAEGDEGAEGRVHSWHPLLASQDDNIELEMDPSAYKMHHALQLDWPALSFDFVRDPWGDARTRFPHSLLVAVGTQADISKRNSIEILKLADLAKVHVETEDDILGEEYNPDKPDDEDEDEMDSDEEDDEDAVEPEMEHVSIKHFGGVNRLRTMPQNSSGTSSSIIATWSDVGKVYLYNVDSVVESFTSSENKTNQSSSLSPYFIHSGHETEGYALDWSKQQPSQQQCQLATGDCAGHIHLWSPRPEGGYQVTPTYEVMHDGQTLSIEDIQWSPTESTVLAASTCGGFCQIYDTRAPHRAMLSHVLSKASNKQNDAAAQELGPDLNVLSWNSLVSNLLATGSDSGELCVWDLRQFTSSPSQKMAPLARFDAHRSPITSVEWHPTDESMLAATDDRGTYVYDFSVEPDRLDDDDTTHQGDGVLPPQLLFTHCGSTQFKEVHWHAQITSCLMTTALSGLSVFIPCNL
jgi:ribosome assembly protein RRB1